MQERIDLKVNTSESTNPHTVSSLNSDWKNLTYDLWTGNKEDFLSPIQKIRPLMFQTAGFFESEDFQNKLAEVKKKSIEDTDHLRLVENAEKIVPDLITTIRTYIPEVLQLEIVANNQAADWSPEETRKQQQTLQKRTSETIDSIKKAIDIINNVLA